MALPGGASESEIHICARSHSHTHTHTYTHAHTHTHTSTHTLSQPQSSGQTPPPVSPTRNWRGTGASLADLRHPPEALAGEVSSVAQDGGGPRSVGALELASPLWRSPLPFALGPHSVVVEENIHRRNGFFSGPSTQPPSRTTPPPSLTPATQGVRRPVMVAPTPVQGKTDIKAQLGPFTAPTSASPSPTPGSLQPQRRREGALARPGSESRLVLPSLASPSPTELLGGGTHVPSPSQGLGATLDTPLPELEGRKLPTGQRSQTSLLMTHPGPLGGLSLLPRAQTTLPFAQKHWPPRWPNVSGTGQQGLTAGPARGRVKRRAAGGQSEA